MNGSSENDIVILGAARTPTGRFMGGLSSFSAPELGALVVDAALKRSGVNPSSVYEVIVGMVIGAGTGQAPARQAALHGGLPDTVGATAVNKVCGSGLKSVMLAANAITAGEADVYVTGGMESMSNAPYLLRRARQGLRFGPAKLEDAILHDGLWCSFQDWVMGGGAEFIARQFEITREEMDAYALQSHEKAAAATAAGVFDKEIVPVQVTGKKGEITRITTDETIRATYDNGGYELLTSMERLAALPPAFAEDGRITAGNGPWRASSATRWPPSIRNGSLLLPRAPSPRCWPGPGGASMTWT
jgi:acetyl-CoA C-acetyltransferase